MNKLLLAACICPVYAMAQTDTPVIPTDSLKGGALSEVVVRAYEQHTNIIDAPVAISIVRSEQLSRFNNTSILPAINNMPGLRMEERSPGSFRFGIRGSSYNAPFGVRNIKTYYNGIPFTDAGGTTYLNQLGYYNIQSLEVIKEPGASLYGAGTGGVMLINSITPEIWHTGGSIAYTTGSFNQQNIMAEVRIGDSSFQNTVRYQHLSSDGYRQQSALRRDVISWDAVLNNGGRGSLSAHFLYSDLYYQTPGALTSAQYEQNPQQARPTANNIPGAIDNNAAIYQRSFLSGFTYQYTYNPHWQSTATAFATYTRLINPTIRNYSRVAQPNLGARKTLKYENSIGASTLQWLLGGEVQQGYSSENTYQNIAGNPGNMQQQNEVSNNILFGFTQLSWQLRRWSFTGGLSVNRYETRLQQLFPTQRPEIKRIYPVQVSPRLAVLYKVNTNNAIYASVAKGYTPPATEQLVPTGSAANLALVPTEGWNYEVGTRGYVLDGRLYYDFAVFYMQLSNTIAQRRDAAGGDYYVNAGSTDQAGAEALLRYRFIQDESLLINRFNIQASYTYNHFRYQNFIQLSEDYSGKALPGIPPHTAALGIDIASRMGLYLNLNGYYNDKIPLNDANSIYANAYTIADARLGYKWKYKRWMTDVFAGGNNLLNETYSLGNDINAAGARYYNAAPGINYYAGLAVHFN